MCSILKVSYLKVVDELGSSLTMKTFFSMLDNYSATYIWRLTLLMVLVLTILSILFNDGLFFEFFYLVPITIASWYGSRKTGISLAIVSTVLLLLVKVIGHDTDITVILSYGFSCAIGYSALALLITNFHNDYRTESIAADTDYLTKIYNARGFYTELANELVRAARYQHVFSLAYLDIDDFKEINDSKGHSEGDRLLIAVAKCLKTSLRASDTVARLGGDEFACLLPETEQVEAKSAIIKTIQQLKGRMSSSSWQVSFSVGMVTFESIPVNIKEAMAVADELMYSVKNKAKNNISYKVWYGNV